MSIIVLLLQGFFCSLFAQSAEDTRAKNWLAFQQLLFKDASAPWSLSASDNYQIDSVQMAPPLQVCTGVTQTSCSVTPPLLVQELKLKGQRLNAQQVQLNWETMGEYNSHIFVVERQTSNPNLFDSVGVLPAAGVSYGKLKYASVDANSYQTNSYYRIKEVDKDGKYMYSNTVSVGGFSGNFEVNVVPNPASNSQLRFYFVTATTGQIINFTITNSSGMLFIKKENLAVSTGYYQVASGEQLPPGTYFIRVHTNGKMYTKQFVIVN
ncbi:MAG: T9SS type A sorting domain-containing protein [Bacteroidota bacterium]|nr:T9SS type A sorting domain-containing protein [Bacteroidota bacterium]